MNSVSVLLLALALFGALANAFVPQCGAGLGYDLGYGAGYGGNYGTGLGARAGSISAPTICDHCHCIKTILRPAQIERIPYTCTRRVQASGYAPAFGSYQGTSADVYSATTGANGFINGGFGGCTGAFGSQNGAFGSQSGLYGSHSGAFGAC